MEQRQQLIGLMPEKNSDDWLKPRQHSRKSHQYRCRSKGERQVERILQAWYGNDAPLEIEAHQGQPTTLDEVMNELLNDWRGGEAVTMTKVIEKWHEIVGFEYKAYTRPALLEGGVLSIEVFSAPLLVNLNQLKDELLRKVQALVGDEVKEIKLIPGGRSSRRGQK